MVLRTGFDRQGAGRDDDQPEPSPSFPDNNITEEIFNEILRQCEAKGLVGGAILYTDSTHIKAKANKHKKKLVEVAVTPKAYLSELDAQVDQERDELGKKPFDRG